MTAKAWSDGWVMHQAGVWEAGVSKAAWVLMRAKRCINDRARIEDLWTCGLHDMSIAILLQFKEKEI